MRASDSRSATIPAPASSAAAGPASASGSMRRSADDARREIGDRDADVPVAVVDADDGSRRRG